MKLLIDAQLPRKMVDWFVSAGCDAIHTFDLPDGNRTIDDQIIERADRDLRIVTTKDEDFVNSHLLQSRPARLLLISTGNISNQDLAQLVVRALPDLVREFQTHSFLELGRGGVVIRG